MTSAPILYQYMNSELTSSMLIASTPDFSLIETILWEPCCGFWLLPEHMSRLRQSAEYFRWQFDQDKLTAQLDSIVKELDYRTHVIHLSVNHNGDNILTAEPVIQDNSPVRAVLASHCIDTSNIHLYHSTSKRQVYDKALSGLSGADEVLLWNEQGEVTESCTSNLIVEADGQYYTPPVSSGLQAGTCRANLIQDGSLIERPITVKQLQDYKKIYLINSRVGWREVQLIDT